MYTYSFILVSLRLTLFGNDGLSFAPEFKGFGSVSGCDNPQKLWGSCPVHNLAASIVSVRDTCGMGLSDCCSLDCMFHAVVHIGTASFLL